MGVAERGCSSKISWLNVIRTGRRDLSFNATDRLGAARKANKLQRLRHLAAGIACLDLERVVRFGLCLIDLSGEHALGGHNVAVTSQRLVYRWLQVFAYHVCQRQK